MKKIFLILTMMLTLGLSTSMEAYESKEDVKDLDLIEMGVDNDITVTAEVNVDFIVNYAVEDSLNVTGEVSDTMILKGDRRLERDNAIKVLSLYSYNTSNYNKYLSQNSDIKVKYLDYDIDRSRSMYRVKVA